MAQDLSFDQDFAAPAGQVDTVSPLVRRVVAGNSGPMTFTGTCSYIVGHGRVAIIDPGPDDPDHVAALLAAVADETVTHIAVTHTHKDHSPAAAALKNATGARLVGCGPHRPARLLAEGEVNPLDGAGDRAYAPDDVMSDGDAIEGPGWRLAAVETPGHIANHVSFALAQEEALFSGDHVMAWSTTFVGPPDGSMTEYMASLEKVRRRDERIYWPGHGGPVREPRRFVRALIHHRRQREASILNRLSEGDHTIPELVANVYQGLAPALRIPAALNVLAHLEDLVERGLAAVDGPLTLDSRFAIGTRDA